MWCVMFHYTFCECNHNFNWNFLMFILWTCSNSWVSQIDNTRVGFCFCVSRGRWFPISSYRINVASTCGCFLCMVLFTGIFFFLNRKCIVLCAILRFFITLQCGICLLFIFPYVVTTIIVLYIIGTILIIVKLTLRNINSAFLTKHRYIVALANSVCCTLTADSCCLHFRISCLEISICTCSSCLHFIYFYCIWSNWSLPSAYNKMSAHRLREQCSFPPIFSCNQIDNVFIKICQIKCKFILCLFLM